MHDDATSPVLLRVKLIPLLFFLAMLAAPRIPMPKVSAMSGQVLVKLATNQGL